MIKLLSLLLEVESDAAKQAHDLGLVSGGWATWKDASGKTVARTVSGQLVKIETEDDAKDALYDFSQHVRDTIPGLNSFELYLSRTNGDIELARIVVDKSARGQGVGTKAMRELLAYADSTKRRVTLSPADKNDNIGTTSKARLIQFYSQLGFVQNKGRHKDFSISDTMYRNPKS